MIKALWPALALVLLAGPVLASPESSLDTVGKLAPFKKTEFYKLKYRDRAVKKAKAVNAYVKFGEAASFYFDSAVQLEALAQGDKLWVYGEPAERETQDENGRTQVDRQIVNTQAVAFGDGLEIPKADPKATGSRWLEATVVRGAAQGLSVTYAGSEYKVVCLRGYAVLHRQLAEKLPKNLKKKKLVEIRAAVSEDRPEKAKSDEVSYTAMRIVFLERRLQASVYPLLLR